MRDTHIHWDEINYASLISQTLRNLWVTVLCVLSAILLYVGFARLTYTPKYMSTATLMVGAKDSTNAYNSLTTTQSMAEVFGEVFQSNVLRDKVQQKMGEETFTGVITAEVIPETNLLTITVTADSPEMAFRGLSIIVEEYDTVSDYLFANAQLQVIKDPVVPLAPSNPLPLRRNCIIIGLLAAMLSLSLIVILCALRDTVSTPKAAQRKLDARLLRTVHHETRNKTLRLRIRRKKNIAPLITAPLISAAFVEDSQSLCTAVEYHTRKREQQVILVTSSGENEGKSTISGNVAAALALRGNRVAVIDCDLRNPSLKKFFDNKYDAKLSLNDLLSQPFDVNKLADAMVLHEQLGMYMLFNHKADRRCTELLSGRSMASLLEHLRICDYVILDMPPMGYFADTEAMLQQVDASVLVVRQDRTAACDINDHIDLLRDARSSFLGVVLNDMTGSLTEGYGYGYGYGYGEYGKHRSRRY